MRGRRSSTEVIPGGQAAVAGANIRILRRRRGWTQAQLGELMGWPSLSTVCAAEGRRDGKQRGFTAGEVERLAAIFNVKAWQLTSRCANCEGHPPDGFACLACGAQGKDDPVKPVNANREFSMAVDAEEVSSSLESTRRLRLALNVLWDDLPGDMNAAEPVRGAMETIHDRINEIESAELRRQGLAEHYLIIRPISLVSPPPPETMEKITQAVGTLAKLGMLVGQHDALYRE
jgi:transcriptional regulator with XRE-family HTH domain